MFRKSRYIFVIALVLLFSTTGNCDEETTTDPIPTYLSRLERTLKAILKPFEIIDKSVKHIGDNIRDAWARIRRVKRSTEETAFVDIKSKSLGEILNMFADKIRAVYPGTRWCGDGNTADDEDDLGVFKNTDACCRAHDNCELGIPAGEVRFGLLNNGIFTRSHCNCDEEFYRCLKGAESLVATKIGVTYFNILRPQCFREDYQIEYCKKFAGDRLLNDKCLEYKFNTTAPRKYQWFDSPDFYNPF